MSNLSDKFDDVGRVVIDVTHGRTNAPFINGVMAALDDRYAAAADAATARVREKTVLRFIAEANAKGN